MREGCFDETHLSRSQWRVDLDFYFGDWGHEGQTIFTLSGFNFSCGFGLFLVQHLCI